MPRLTNPVTGLLKAMAAAARTLKAELIDLRGDRQFARAAASLAKELGRDLPPEETADVLAQAIVCAAPILASASQQRPRAVKWLAQTGSEWERWVLDQFMPAGRRAKSRYGQQSTQYLVLSTYPSAPDRSSFDSRVGHLYDLFLQRYASSTRKRHGVYFTPFSIAHYLVRQVDAVLKRDFGQAGGLAHTASNQEPPAAIEILDPACGTGVFLLAVLDYLHARLGADFRDFIPDLVPRLIGVELLPVPALLAKLNLALALAKAGCDWGRGGPIRIIIGDALSPELQSTIRNSQSAIPVLLGNPPFGSLSTNTNPWIAALIRGNGDVRGYLQAGGERLGERKTWLHDDYVKFIRLAQWHVEQAGQGIVAFVTNHGYLDNATFRLMRQELVRVFPRIKIVDLHGSRKKGETAPDGGPDENVFGLDQGVSIGVFSRPSSLTRGANKARASVQYAELWGPRKAKLACLAAERQLPRQPLSPAAPHFRLVPESATCPLEYAAAWPLQRVMPAYAAAPVTARDHFVVAFTREELVQRIAEFRDLSIADDVIRAKYFHRTRSRRYPRGDTRGWKLPEARRIVAADDTWQQHIIRCCYRPFDWRYVFWHPAMIDWPRNEITRHLIEIQNPKSKIQNLCLIARRQQLPTQPCTYFWISDCVALDGVIRSDNRGSESLFPLWLGDCQGATAGLPSSGNLGQGQSAPGTYSANFAPEFLSELARLIGRQPDPQHTLAYIYALFHSPTYRERYAAQLRVEFPRILLPGSRGLFDALATAGQRLIALHLLRATQVAPPLKDTDFAEFRVGGYAALKKWLQPKHRSRQDAEYSQIAAATNETMGLMAEIDRCIECHGGLPAAFAAKARPLVGVMGAATFTGKSP